jgi:hypothetical protein
MTPTVQNLNAKLSPRPSSKPPRRGTQPGSGVPQRVRSKVRIAGSAAPYAGGFRVNV